MMVDAFRVVIVLMIAVALAMSCISLARVRERRRVDDGVVRVPARVMEWTLVCLIVSGLGAVIQLVSWILLDAPFALYRAPLVFVVALTYIVAASQLVNFTYPRKR